MKLNRACRQLARQLSSQIKIKSPLDRFRWAGPALPAVQGRRTAFQSSHLMSRGVQHSPRAAAQGTGALSYLGQLAAQRLDEDLMGPLGFSVDQLMELAGLSVACAVHAEYPKLTHPRVLILAGPGNNGGDGLVAARHLHHFGYSVSICYPKRTDRELYKGLVTQCTSLGIPFLESERVLAQPLRDQADVVLDALFGFSFKGTPRPPFDALIAAMSPTASPPPVACVDIPSGWDVEEGDVAGAAGESIQPDMLISLTAPKLCAKRFEGRHHYLGGRFVPPEIVRKYQLSLPEYPGTAQCVRIGGGGGGSAAALAAGVADMRLHYGAAGQGLDESAAARDPFTQFSAWFEDARRCEGVREPNAMALATAGPEGAPSLRMVLLKGFDSRGITFFTNYDSRKGRELGTNPSAAATFFWEDLERQIRFEGEVERLPAAESDAYWQSRPRSSQLGGLASRQSEIVPGGRAELEALEAAVVAAHPEIDVPIPRPHGWGGLLLRPTVVEFWQGRPSRLHDRLRYTLQHDGSWKMERLGP